MNNVKNGQSAAKQVLVKPIKGWEDKYLAYSDGRIYSLLRNKFLKPRMSMDGYEGYVYLTMAKDMSIEYIV